MDNLTHSATGYFLSRAGLDRLTPYATPILLLAANAPDVDILALAAGSVSYLHWHRNLTHALIAAPVLALLCVALVRVCVRKPLPWLAATGVAMLGVLSHLFLDWVNQYGVRLLLPFSGQWYRMDNATLFDLWIYGVFAICIFAPLLSRLVGGEIGAKQRSPGQGWAIAAILFLGVYFAGRGVIHAKMVDVLNARMYNGAQPLRVAAFPLSSTPFRWTGLVETDGAYRVYSLALAPGSIDPAFDPGSAQIFYKAEKSAALEAAKKTAPFQTFLEFAQYPLWQTTPSAEADRGTQVDLVDLRFPFHCRAVVDSSNRVVKSEYRVRD